jgi:hypothetical protein
MTTLLEDIRLALRQICRAIGLDETAATVIPLVVLGLALNIAALSAVEFLRIGGKTNHTHNALRNAARTEMKAIRIVVHSTIKKINDRKQQLCQPRQWVKNQQKQLNQYHFEVGVVWTAPVPGEGCDLKLVGKPDQPRMIAFVQC